LDTYAYRSTNTQEHVFEVDLPSTQYTKLALLNKARLSPTTSVTYVACDFEENNLCHDLTAAGFNKNQPAFFSWLGVTPYLNLAAIEKTLAFITQCAPGSQLVFDYIVDPLCLSDIERIVLDILSATLATTGEPLQSFFNPTMLAKKLNDIGFSKVDDIGCEYLNAHYLSQREDGMQAGNVTRLFKVMV